MGGFGHFLSPRTPGNFTCKMAEKEAGWGGVGERERGREGYVVVVGLPSQPWFYILLMMQVHDAKHCPSRDDM